MLKPPQVSSMIERKVFLLKFRLEEPENYLTGYNHRFIVSLQMHLTVLPPLLTLLTESSHSLHSFVFAEKHLNYEQLLYVLKIF